MQFSLAAAALISISGATTRADLASSEVAAGVDVSYYDKPTKKSPSNAATADIGKESAECVLINAFKQDRDRNADTGILSCGFGETCVEDEKSSLGGRCVAIELEDEGTAVDETHQEISERRKLGTRHPSTSPTHAPSSQWPSSSPVVLDQPIACLFNNGTAGFKCVGKR